jgi:FAD/FMN-containing dehydrogenase
MTPSMSQWRGLQRTIAGDVLVPGSPGYERMRKPFIARFDEVRPEAVVLCANPDDVAETMALARRHHLETATRSGGHCFAGRSSTRGVLIDVTPMNSVSVSDGVATVGAGTRLGDMYERLVEQGLTVPAGSCPSVGIAGLTLGGGLGILGRKYGLTSDHLLGAQIVLADGRVVECDDHHDEELFWALRGAGAGNFGVVTSFGFRPHPAPATTNFRLDWPFSSAVSVTEAWQAWATTIPDELAASLVMESDARAEQPPSVEVLGAMAGPDSDVAELLDDLVARVGAEPASSFLARMPWRETTRFWAELDQAAGDPANDLAADISRQGFRYTKSEFFERPLPSEAIAALVENFEQERASGQDRGLDFSLWGGAYNSIRADATAFAHRDKFFSLKHAIIIDPAASAAEKKAAHRWVLGSWRSVHRYGSGRVFPNFPDPELEDWARAYYGANYERLLGVKARYDPDGFFRFRQSL